MSNSDSAGLPGFESLKDRLEEIVQEVSRDDISLDDALALYEEAVNIGLSACDASETDVQSEDDGEPATG